MDHTILMQCVAVFLSYLPEAGQYSCIFVYLKLKMHFSSAEVSIFIAVVGILSILAQLVLGVLMRLVLRRSRQIGQLFVREFLRRFRVIHRLIRLSFPIPECLDRSVQ